MQDRTFGSYSTAKNRILVSLTIPSIADFSARAGPFPPRQVPPSALHPDWRSDDIIVLEMGIDEQVRDTGCPSV
jgi:hypothetical protein